MRKHGFVLVVLVAIVAVILLRRHAAATTIAPDEPAADPTIPQSGRPRPSASTLVGPGGPAPFSADTRGSHYLSQFQTLRRD